MIGTKPIRLGNYLHSLYNGVVILIAMFNLNKTKCAYIIEPEFIYSTLPKSVFNNIENLTLGKHGCPSIHSIKNKIYNVNSYLNIEIEFGIKDNEAYYKYYLDESIVHLSSEVHDKVDKLIFINNDNDFLTLQLLAPYAFVTDDKDLEFVTVTPSMKTENCMYVNGGFKPYNWIRNINSSWTIKDRTKPAKLYFNINDPFISVAFNKNINLEYIETNEKIINYIKQSFQINEFRKNLGNSFKNAISRRPKKLL